MSDDFIHRFLSSPEQMYKHALDRINDHKFNRNADWNREYRSLLAELGLCLRYKKTRPYHINAPTPAMGHGHAWPRGMFIVEAVPLHPLHEEVWYEEQGEQGIQADPDRHTGRTTALALRIIHDAIINPHQKIDIIDHTAYRRADKHLAHQVADMVGMLQLQHMHVDVSKREEYTLIFERRPE